ncbi:MAG: helix-turn-helix domain-containing protein [Chitinophagales bacterium]|nr:helix-turn-helix domain-containing protein [Chitinophagales bacterium]
MNRSILLEQMSGEQILARFDILEAQLKTLQNQPTPTPAPGYLSRQEVAKLLRVSGVTVWDWTNKGFLKAYRLGNKVFYKAAEIDGAMVEIKKGGRRNEK